MNNPSFYLLGVGTLLVIMTVLFTYWKTMVTHDFVVIDDVEEEVASETFETELFYSIEGETNL